MHQYPCKCSCARSDSFLVPPAVARSKEQYKNIKSMVTTCSSGCPEVEAGVLKPFLHPACHCTPPPLRSPCVHLNAVQQPQVARLGAEPASRAALVPATSQSACMLIPCDSKI